MKTAISIPDNIFQAAENMAQHLKVSRSELFTTAISEYMKRNRNKDITKSLNKIYGDEDSAIDDELASMQMNSFHQENW